MTFLKNLSGLNLKSKSPFMMLAIMSAAVTFSFSTWRTLLDNFSTEIVHFQASDIGILQSIREIPGLLAFTAILLLYIFREQTLAIISIILMGFGVAIVGFFPSIAGLYITTVIMSLGFHYYETMSQSLTLQMFSKKDAPEMLGKLISVSAFAGLLALAVVYILFNIFDIGYTSVYLLVGCVTMIIAIYIYVTFPKIKVEHEQKKGLVLRKNYWLYYALTFMGGARRQIFVVFAGWLLVTKFGFTVGEIVTLYFVNSIFNIYLAPKIGLLIKNWGERRVLTLEYLGLIAIFLGYGFVDNAWLGVILFLADHAFFAMAIAQKTYFQKIADPKDFAPTAGVAFSINHIAAIGLPAVYGFIWISHGASAVFFIGAAFATVSLILARLIPKDPMKNNEFIWSKPYKAKIAE